RGRRRRQLSRRGARLQDRGVRAQELGIWNLAFRMLATNSKFRIPNSQLHGALVVFLVCATLAAQPRPVKHVLAWADVRNGYQHDSISHAVAVIERLGHESGAYDTVIRTDSQLITKRPITFPAGTGIATGEQFNVRNLDYFDAIFFFGVREIDLSAAQRDDLLSFVRDDGKCFGAAHAAATAFFSWPEFGDLLGGRFDEHPWGVAEGTVVVDDPRFPAMRHFPPRVVVRDELYQLKDFSRDRIHVVA